MSFTLGGGQIITEQVKIANATPADLFTSISPTTILSIVCAENTGAGTPTLTVEKYDVANATSYVLRKRAMTAGETFVFDEPFRLERNWKIRITSTDAAGKVDAHVTYFDPNAGAAGGQ